MKIFEKLRFKDENQYIHFHVVERVLYSLWISDTILKEFTKEIQVTG